MKWFAMSISVCVYNKVRILEDLEPECILESAQLLEEHSQTGSRLVHRFITTALVSYG